MLLMFCDLCTAVFFGWCVVCVGVGLCDGTGEVGRCYSFVCQLASHDAKPKIKLAKRDDY